MITNLCVKRRDYGKLFDHLSKQAMCLGCLVKVGNVTNRRTIFLLIRLNFYNITTALQYFTKMDGENTKKIYQEFLVVHLM